MKHTDIVHHLVAKFKSLKGFATISGKKASGTYILTRALDREDKHPSLSIWVPKKGMPKAMDLARGGQWVPLLEYVQTYAPETAREIAELLQGIPQEDDKPTYGGYRPYEAAKFKEVKPLPPHVRDAISRAKSMLRFYDGKRKEVYGYLRERLPWLSIGELIRLSEHGIGVDEVGNLYFPSWLPGDKGLEMVNVQVRQRKDEPRYKFLAAGNPIGLFLIGNLQNPERILLFEGPVDAVSAFTVFGPEWLYIATHGANNVVPANFADMIAGWDGAQWVLVADPDKAGEEWRQKNANALMWLGVPREAILFSKLDNVGRDFNDRARDGWNDGGGDPLTLKKFMLRWLSPRPQMVKKGHNSPYRAIYSWMRMGKYGLDSSQRGASVPFGGKQFSRVASRTRWQETIPMLHFVEWAVGRSALVRRKLAKNTDFRAEFPAILNKVLASPVIRTMAILAGLGEASGKTAYLLYKRIQPYRGRLEGKFEWGTARAYSGKDYSGWYIRLVDPEAVAQELMAEILAAVKSWRPRNKEERKRLTLVRDAAKTKRPIPLVRMIGDLWEDLRMRMYKAIGVIQAQREVFYSFARGPAVAI